jgi:hypothetical protein
VSDLEEMAKAEEQFTIISEDAKALLFEINNHPLRSLSKRLILRNNRREKSSSL